MNQRHLNIARIRLAWAWASASQALIDSFWTGTMPLSREVRR